MSGGAFDYAYLPYLHVENFADALERKFDATGAPSYHGFKPEVVAEMRRAVVQARHLASVMRAVELLWGSDDSEETFMRKMMDLELKNFVTE